MGNIRILLCLLAFVVCSCEKQEQATIPTTRFDLADAKQMKMADFVESISLVPLETNDSSLLKSTEQLYIHNDRFVIKDKGCLFFFDRQGNFLFSTRHLQGAGPEQYRVGLDFTLLPDNGMEVFDAMTCKLLHYDADMRLVSTNKLSRNILPTSGYLKVSEDVRLFLTADTLKWYSLKEDKIVEKTVLPFHYKMIRFQKVPWYKKGNSFFYAGNYPQNELYRLDVERKVLEACHLFDFGKYRLDMQELPSGMEGKYYRDYPFENKKAFVADKYVDEKRALCILWYDKRFNLAYQDFRTGKSAVYYNEWGTKDQLGLPLLYEDDVLYAFAEPEALEYWLDESLLSVEEKEKMKNIHEEDNPVLICYKLK